MSTKAQYLLGTLSDAEQRRYMASSRASRRSSFSGQVSSTDRIHPSQGSRNAVVDAPEPQSYPLFSVLPQPRASHAQTLLSHRVSSETLRSFAPPTIPTYLPSRHGASPFLHQNTLGKNVAISSLSAPASNLAVPLYDEDTSSGNREWEQKRGIRHAFSKLTARTPRGRSSNAVAGEHWTDERSGVDGFRASSPYASSEHTITSPRAPGQYSASSKASKGTPSVFDLSTSNGAPPRSRNKTREWFDDMESEDDERRDYSTPLQSPRSVISNKSSKAASILGMDVSQLPDLNSSLARASKRSEAKSQQSIIHEHPVVSSSDSEGDDRLAKPLPRKDSGYRSMVSSVTHTREEIRPPTSDADTGSNEVNLSMFPSVPTIRAGGVGIDPRRAKTQNGLPSRPQKRPPAHLTGLSRRPETADDSGSESLPSLAGSASTTESTPTSKPTTPYLSSGLKTNFDATVIVEDENIILTPIDASESELSLVSGLKHDGGTNRIIAAISPEEAILISRIRRHKNGALTNFSDARVANERIEDHTQSASRSRSASQSSAWQASKPPYQPAPPLPTELSAEEPLQNTTPQFPSIGQDGNKAPIPPAAPIELPTSAPTPAPPAIPAFATAPLASPPLRPSTSTGDIAPAPISLAPSAPALAPIPAPALPSSTTAGQATSLSGPLAPPRSSSLPQANGAASPPSLFRPMTPNTEQKRRSKAFRPATPAPSMAPPPPPPVPLPVRPLQRARIQKPPVPVTPPQTSAPTTPRLAAQAPMPTAPALPSTPVQQTFPSTSVPIPRESPEQTMSIAGAMYSPDSARDVLEVLRQLGG